MRSVLYTLFLLTMTGASALAQIPAGPGQQPGTLPPAPPVIAPPPLVVPPPVPSVVTPLRSPTYGVPPGVTRAPSYGSGTATLRYSYPPPKRKNWRKNLRKYRGSMLFD